VLDHGAEDGRDEVVWAARDEAILLGSGDEELSIGYGNEAFLLDDGDGS
jgi:hypothetical protein